MRRPAPSAIQRGGLELSDEHAAMDITAAVQTIAADEASLLAVRRARSHHLGFRHRTIRKRWPQAVHVMVALSALTTSA